MNIRKSKRQGICTAKKGVRGKCMLAAGVVCVLALLHTVLPAAAEESAVAAVMQLMKTEGEVAILNGSGRSISLIKNMRLYNGYSATTQEESYAWINLDSEKLAKLDAVSEAEVRKSGKKLEILLDSGNLFFNVTEDLEEDETLNIRTSTMVMGIRGTSGWVRVIDRWHSQVYLLEGEVSCSVTDPVTGQVKTTVLKSGEMAEFVVYSQDQAGDKCDIIRQGFSGDEISGFVLMELAGNDSLCKKIQDASGMDVKSYAANAEVRLARDQEEMRQKMDMIRRLLDEQENYISKDPVWERGSRISAPSPGGTPNPSPGGNTGSPGNHGGNNAGTGPGTGRGSGTGTGSGRFGASPAPAASGATPSAAPNMNTGSNTDDTGTASDSASDTPNNSDTPTTPNASATPIVYEFKDSDVVTLDAIIDKLNEDGVDGVVVPSDVLDTLTIDKSLEIPEGKTLTVNNLTVINSPDQPISKVTVKGSLEVEGNLTNYGEIIIGEDDRP